MRCVASSLWGLPLGNLRTIASSQRGNRRGCHQDAAKDTHVSCVRSTVQIRSWDRIHPGQEHFSFLREPGVFIRAECETP
jgi:hypothetical protein